MSSTAVRPVAAVSWLTKRHGRRAVPRPAGAPDLLGLRRRRGTAVLGPGDPRIGCTLVAVVILLAVTLLAEWVPLAFPLLLARGADTAPPSVLVRAALTACCWS